MPESKSTNDLPRMVPDRDDIRVRTSPRQPDTKSSIKPPPVVKQAANHSWLNTVWVLIGGIAIAYLALQQYSLTETLKSYEERLTLADDRIVFLEQSLTQTDESVTMNETAINAQFKAIKSQADLQMSEIRKLWDVTNKRNKAWIEDNQAELKKQVAALDSLSKKADSLEATLTGLNADVEQKDLVIGQLNVKSDQQRALIESAQAEITALSAQLDSLSFSEIEEQIVSIRFAQENLFAEQGILTDNDAVFAQKMAEIQTSVDSVSASRVETNKRLSTVTKQIEALDGRITAIAGPAAQ
jgi:chromosome segregation ATPase